MMKLIFFVPESHKEEVKRALFMAGAGVYDGYDSCCWEVEGWGQFRPLSGSDPFIGSAETLERVKEYRVEMVFPKEKRASITEALLKTHPYEVPAYEIWDGLIN